MFDCSRLTAGLMKQTRMIKKSHYALNKKEHFRKGSQREGSYGSFVAIPSQKYSSKVSLIFNLQEGVQSMTLIIGQENEVNMLGFTTKRVK